MRSSLLLFFVFLGGCSNLFYQPTKRHFTEPKQFKLAHQEVWFASKDGTKLHGWFFPATTKTVKGTVVQFHGNAENISTHFFSLIWLIKEGYNLFTWDYRGYGFSEGEPSQKGVHEDALAALEEGKKLHGGKGLFIVYGQSLGGAVSMRAVPDSKHAGEVDLLVHDSSFASYQTVASKVLRKRWFLWPFSPLAYVLVSDAYAPEDVISRLTSPTLVIVGEQDAVVPPELGKETYEKLPMHRKWLWKLPAGSHIDVYHHADGKYRQPLLDLLEDLGRK